VRAGDLVAVRAGEVAVRAGDVEPFGTDTPENPGLCGRMAVACRAPALNPYGSARGGAAKEAKPPEDVTAGPPKLLEEAGGPPKVPPPPRIGTVAGEFEGKRAAGAALVDA